jgi:anthranilate synthase/aminodeoxychorismate synthase-like glutamine amidotransferase
MIAVIDNYDSFTYNLVQFLGELVQQMPVRGESRAEIRVWRNDAIDVEELAELRPTHIVISPGPGTPEKDSGISNDVIRILGQTTPILGVCLGQQCIGYVFGGQVVRAPRLMHGKVSPVHHKGVGVDGHALS